MSRKRYLIYILLAVVILAQVCYITYCFDTKKKDYHSDEVWSYGPANSYDYPFFYSTKDWSADQHFNEWLPGELMSDYLTVQDGEEFAYAKIYENTSKDLHQPLYFFILHTICSFFKGTFSWWYGFGINLFFFIIGQVFLFLLVKKITRQNYLAFLVCIAYGFSQGAINNTIFIRMYSMITCLGIISVYLHTLIYYDSKKMKQLLPIIWTITFAGGVTHSFFLAFAGSLSACFCFYYLFKREYKNLIIYAVTLLSAAMAVFLLYPHTISHAETYNDRNTTEEGYLGFWFEYRYLIFYLFLEMFGIVIAPMPRYYVIHIVEVLLVMAVVVVPLAFVFRNEVWFKKIKAVLSAKLKNLPNYMSKKFNWLLAILAITVYMVILITSRMAHIFRMSYMSTRYVFVIQPYFFVVLFCVAASLIGFVIRLAKKVKPVKSDCLIAKNVMLGLVAFVVIAINVIFASEKYYFDYEEDGVDLYLSELPKDANYILGIKSNWFLDCTIPSLQGVDNFFAANYQALFYLEEQLNTLKSDKDVYLILATPGNSDIESDEEIIQIDDQYDEKLKTLSDITNEKIQGYIGEYESFFLSLNICDEFTYTGHSQIFGRDVFVFKVR